MRTRVPRRDDGRHAECGRKESVIRDRNDTDDTQYPNEGWPLWWEGTTDRDSKTQNPETEHNNQPANRLASSLVSSLRGTVDA
jgi:hypothetical protein